MDTKMNLINLEVPDYLKSTVFMDDNKFKSLLEDF